MQYKKEQSNKFYIASFILLPKIYFNTSYYLMQLQYNFRLKLL